MRVFSADDFIMKEIARGVYLVDEETIRNAPTFDAEPVVRCGECKKWGTGKGSFNRCPMDMDDWTKADDYCSYGERKDKT